MAHGHHYTSAITAALDKLQSHHVARCNQTPTLKTSKEVYVAKKQKGLVPRVTVDRVKTKYPLDHFAMIIKNVSSTPFAMLYLAIKYHARAKIALQHIGWYGAEALLEGLDGAAPSDEWGWDHSISACLKRPVAECPVVLQRLGMRPSKTTGIGHSNMLIVDRVNRTVERFDSHGGGDDFEKVVEFRLYLLDAQLAAWASENGLCYMPPAVLNGLRGTIDKSDGSVQDWDNKGYCVALSIWYADLRLAYPELHPMELWDAMVSKVHGMGGDKAMENYMLSYVNQIYALMVAIFPQHEKMFRDKEFYASFGDKAIPDAENTLLKQLQVFAHSPYLYIKRVHNGRFASLQEILEKPALLTDHYHLKNPKPKLVDTR